MWASKVMAPGQNGRAIQHIRGPGVHQPLAGDVIRVHGETGGGHQEIDAAVQEFPHRLADGPPIIRHNQGFEHLAAEFLHLGGDDGDELVLHQPHEDLGAGDQDADPGLAQGQHLEQRAHR